MKMDRESLTVFGGRLIYFVLTIVVFGSLGVSIPLAIDFFKNQALTNSSLSVTPTNMITYALSIFLIAFIDRMLFLIRHQRKSYTGVEFLLLTILGVIQVTIVYFTYRRLYHKEMIGAIELSFLLVILAWIMWWIANKREDYTSPYASLGGEIN